MAKTTIEIPDDLLVDAKALAARERTTLRELVIRGLRAVVLRQGSSSAFELRDGSVPGNGLRPEFRDAGWERIRDAIYAPERR